jgi:hypothetical protein
MAPMEAQFQPKHPTTRVRRRFAMPLAWLRSPPAPFFPLSLLLTCFQKTQQSTSPGAICRRDKSPIARALPEGHVASRQTNSRLGHQFLESYLLDGHAAKKFPIKQRAALRSPLLGAALVAARFSLSRPAARQSSHLNIIDALVGSCDLKTRVCECAPDQ